LIQHVEDKIEKEKEQFTKKALVQVKKCIDEPEEFFISVSLSESKPLSRIIHRDDQKEMYNVSEC
jgi:hypothetical protein